MVVKNDFKGFVLGTGYLSHELLKLEDQRKNKQENNIESLCLASQVREIYQTCKCQVGIRIKELKTSKIMSVLSTDILKAWEDILHICDF